MASEFERALLRWDCSRKSRAFELDLRLSTKRNGYGSVAFAAAEHSAWMHLAARTNERWIAQIRGYAVGVHTEADDGPSSLAPLGARPLDQFVPVVREPSVARSVQARDRLGID